MMCFFLLPLWWSTCLVFGTFCWDILHIVNCLWMPSICCYTSLMRMLQGVAGVVVKQLKKALMIWNITEGHLEHLLKNVNIKNLINYKMFYWKLCKPSINVHHEIHPANILQLHAKQKRKKKLSSLSQPYIVELVLLSWYTCGHI